MFLVKFLTPCTSNLFVIQWKKSLSSSRFCSPVDTMMNILNSYNRFLQLRWLFFTLSVICLHGKSLIGSFPWVSTCFQSKLSCVFWFRDSSRDFSRGFLSNLFEDSVWDFIRNFLQRFLQRFFQGIPPWISIGIPLGISPVILGGFPGFLLGLFQGFIPGSLYGFLLGSLNRPGISWFLSYLEAK